MLEVWAGIVMATAGQLLGWGHEFACRAPDCVNLLFSPLIVKL